MNTEIATLTKILSIMPSIIDEIQNSHWNIKGPNFGTIHPDLGSIYSALIGWQDIIAERIKVADTNFLVTKGSSDIVKSKSDQSAIVDSTISILQQFVDLVKFNLKSLGEVTANELLTMIAEFEKWIWKFTNSK